MMSIRSKLTLFLLAIAASLIAVPAARAGDLCERYRHAVNDATRLANQELDVGFERHFAEKELDKAERKLDQNPAANADPSGGWTCRAPTGDASGGRLYQHLGDRPVLFGEIVCGLQMDRSSVSCARAENPDFKIVCELLAGYFDHRSKDTDLPIWVMDQVADNAFENDDPASGLAAALFGGAMKQQQFRWCVNRNSSKYETEYDAWTKVQQLRDNPQRLLELCRTWQNEQHQAAAKHADLKERHEQIVRGLNEARRNSRELRNEIKRRDIRCP